MQGYNLTINETNRDKNDVKFEKGKNVNIGHFLLIAGVIVGLVIYADKKLDDVI